MSLGTRLRRCRGFTLVEVLVSVAMLGILVLPLMGIFTQSLRSVHAGRSQVTAAFHAQHLMDEFVLTYPDEQDEQTPPGPIDGTFSFARAVRTHPDTGLTEVVITVFWQQGAIARNLRVVSLIAPR